MVFNPQIHHRRSIRLKGYDYSQVGLYFITLCCQDRASLFGEIVGAIPSGRPNNNINCGHPNNELNSVHPNDKINNFHPNNDNRIVENPNSDNGKNTNANQKIQAKLILNDAGKMIEKQWLSLADRFPNIILHEYIIMPNHFHGIIEIVDTGRKKGQVRGFEQRQARDIAPTAPTAIPTERKIVGSTLVVDQDSRTKEAEYNNQEKSKTIQLQGLGQGQARGIAPTKAETIQTERKTVGSTLVVDQDSRTKEDKYNKQEKSKTIQLQGLDHGQALGIAPTTTETIPTERKIVGSTLVVDQDKHTKEDKYNNQEKKENLDSVQELGQELEQGQAQGIAPTDPTAIPTERKTVGSTLVVDQDKRTKEDKYNNQEKNENWDSIQEMEQGLGQGQARGIAPTDPTVGSTLVVDQDKRTIGDILAAFKSITTVEYIRGVKNNNWKSFNGKLWQRNYYEHIIRNEEAYLKISNYIINNPQKWLDDKFYKK
jgi:REP element-mobilizing transposase RayT